MRMIILFIETIDLQKIAFVEHPGAAIPQILVAPKAL
jgi:hypothetical protein